MDLPLQLQTAYQDLLQHHFAEPPLTIEGSIIRREREGRGYWVARQRLGEKVVEVAIGPDVAEVKAQVAQALSEQEIRKIWLRSASADVAILRAGRCLAPDMQTGRLLAAIAKAGFFTAGGILGGTQAFRHYPLMLGVEAPVQKVVLTGDVDLLTPAGLRLVGTDRSLTTRIAELGISLAPVFGLDPDQAPKFRAAGVIDLEFLSTVGRGADAGRLHPGIGERVQALRFIEFSMKDPEWAVSLYRSGVMIRVPRPERYALHKLMVAELRSGSFIEKRHKDLDQASWLISVLEDRRAYELWVALDDLCRRGKKWVALVGRALEKRPKIREVFSRIEEEFGAAGA